MKRAIFMLSILFSASASAADPAVDKIIECMRANIPQTIRIQDFEITTIDRAKGQRILRGRLYAKNDKGLVRSTIKIVAPPDLANAAYLIREGKEKDDMFVYLPALNKARRITGSNADGALFGTDLSYSDIKQLHNAFSGGAVKLEKADVLEGRPVKVLSMVPRADAQSRYSLVRTWVDDQTCLGLKAEFHEGATVRKRLTINSKKLQQSAGNWYPAESEMLDVKQGTLTKIKITGVTSDGKLSDTLFNNASFYIGG